MIKEPVSYLTNFRKFSSLPFHYSFFRSHHLLPTMFPFAEISSIHILTCDIIAVQRLAEQQLSSRVSLR